MATYANALRSASVTWEDTATLIETVIGSSSNDAVSTSYSPSYTQSGAMTYTSVTTNLARYVYAGPFVVLILNVTGTTGGTADASIQVSLPVASISGNTQAGWIYITDGSFARNNGFWSVTSASSTLNINKDDSSVWTLGSGRAFIGTVVYLRA